MAGVEHVALLLQQFDQVEAVGGLDDLRDDPRLEGHGRIAEGRPENRTGSHAELAAAAGAARVFGVDAGEGREFLAVDDALTDVEKALLGCKSRRFPVGIEADLAELVADRHFGKVFGRRIGQVFLDIIGCDFGNAAGDFLLLLLGQGLIFEGRLPFLAQTVKGLAEIGLDGLIASELGTDAVEPLRELALDHIGVDGQGVDPGLDKENL